MLFSREKSVLQNKLVQREGLFVRLKSIQTSDRLCTLQKYNFMVPIESVLLSKSVNYRTSILDISLLFL